MLLAFLADLIGLASIVGAFAAGLILKDAYFDEANKRVGISSADSHHGHGKQSVEAIIAPIEGIFAPIFFVMMGVQVDIMSFAKVEIIGIALAITAVAIIGKLGSAVFLDKKLDKLVVGIGMVPRGEVGLIFASIGKALGVLDAGLFSAIIIVVILTTLITPPLLKWAVERKIKREAALAG
jgi:Kef-type K+ transport system membrane component KefB